MQITLRFIYPLSVKQVQALITVMHPVHPIFDSKGQGRLKRLGRKRFQTRSESKQKDPGSFRATEGHCYRGSRVARAQLCTIVSATARPRTLIFHKYRCDAN